MISQIFLLLSNWPKYFINYHTPPLQGKHIVIARSIATPDFRSHFVLGYIWGDVVMLKPEALLLKRGDLVSG
jgi:hypothetical protein